MAGEHQPVPLTTLYTQPSTTGHCWGSTLLWACASGHIFILRVTVCGKADVPGQGNAAIRHAHWGQPPRAGAAEHLTEAGSSPGGAILKHPELVPNFISSSTHG